MSFPEHVFRAYDIRGIADLELSDELAENLGRALGSRVRRAGGSRFAVGRDIRLSGDRLHAALTRGLMSTGLEVLDVGRVPTPMLYFAVFYHDLDGGVEITGSHNPPEFNGFKMLVGKDTLHSDDITGLRDEIRAGDFVEGEGSIREFPIEDTYLDWIVDNVKIGPRKLKILLDGANGIAGPSALRLLERLGQEVIGFCIEPDGRFPHHAADPTVVETLDIIRAEVERHGADLGIGLDGDGDRIGVVDGNGDILWGDSLLTLFSRALLEEVPGATIVSEVKCSQTLYDDIEAKGGKAVMWKAGHSLIKSKMAETGALLAGEMSGHIFFKHRYFGFDDATYSAARLLEILTHTDQSASDLLADIPEAYATPEIRVDVDEAAKFGIVERLADKLKADGYDVIDIDGVRVRFDDGWGLIRASNTQPVLVLRAEATSPERRDEIHATLESWLKETA